MLSKLLVNQKKLDTLINSMQTFQHTKKTDMKIHRATKKLAQLF